MKDTPLLQAGDKALLYPSLMREELAIDAKIVLMDKQECVFLKIIDIYYIEAQGAYSCVYFSNERKMLVSKNMKLFALRLPEAHFYRIHKSYLVNVNYISKYVKSDGGYVLMENGAVLPVSIRKRDTFMQLVDKLSV